MQAQRVLVLLGHAAEAAVWQRLPVPATVDSAAVDALDAVAVEPIPALIVLDVPPPRQAEAVAAVCARYPECPRVLLGTRVEEGPAAEAAAREAGADAVIWLAVPDWALAGQVSAHLQAALLLDDLHRREQRLRALAHDTRLPLFSIKGYAGLLLDGSLGELTADQREALTVIAAATERATVYLSDLLETAEEAHEPVRVGLLEVVRPAVQALSGTATRAQVHVTVEAAGGEPHVLGDPIRLGRMVLNLLANALDHAPAGSTVTLSLAEEARQAVLAVHDEGPGVAPEARQRLFERGYRGASARPGGVGLGLAIAREIARSYGGDIQLSADTATGATFLVTLPAAPPADDGPTSAADRAG